MMRCKAGNIRAEDGPGENQVEATRVAPPPRGSSSQFELSRSGLLAVPLLQVLNIFLHRDVLAGLVLLFHVRLFRIGLARVDEWIVLIGLA
jgi:hypothetical protein